MLPEAQPRQGFVEEADFRAIVKHLEPGPALAATIAYETVWRCRSEILTLTSDRVNVEGGRIRLDGADSKNGQPWTAYLSPATTKLLVEQRARVEALDRQLKRIINDVFVHENGRLRGRRICEFRKAWRRACRHAGRVGLLLHDLRRSDVRSLIRSRTPEGVAMKISGHKTRAIFDRYNIVSEADLREAAKRRAQFGHNPVSKVVPLVQ
jgi:hypothetical protein